MALCAGHARSQRWRLAAGCWPPGRCRISQQPRRAQAGGPARGSCWSGRSMAGRPVPDHPGRRQRGPPRRLDPGRPGDYHENADETGPSGNPAVGAMGGVYITKSGITLRGMNRNTVIVDGTKPGSAPCSSRPAAQDYGAAGARGRPRRPQRDPGLEGQRRQRREPDGLQLPRGHGRVGQPDLVERRGRLGQDRPDRLLGQLPDRHLDVLRQRDHRRRVRHLRRQLGRPGLAGPSCTAAT